VLCVGMLDGLYRASRQAETLFFSLPRAPDMLQRIHSAQNSALVVYEGVNHMQFASGAPPPTVAANDLAAEVTDADAHGQMATTISAWLLIQLGERPMVSRAFCILESVHID
jgi:hypothetical protein